MTLLNRSLWFLSIAGVAASALVGCGGDVGDEADGWGEEDVAESTDALVGAQLVMTEAYWNSFSGWRKSSADVACPDYARGGKLEKDFNLGHSIRRYTIHVCILPNSTLPLPNDAASCSGDQRAEITTTPVKTDVVLENSLFKECMTRLGTGAVVGRTCNAALAAQSFRFETVRYHKTVLSWRKVLGGTTGCYEWPGPSAAYSRMRNNFAPSQCFGFAVGDSVGKMLPCQAPFALRSIKPTTVKTAMEKVAADLSVHGFYISDGPPAGWQLIRKGSATSLTLNQKGRGEGMGLSAQNKAPYGPSSVWKIRSR